MGEILAQHLGIREIDIKVTGQLAGAARIERRHGEFALGLEGAGIAVMRRQIQHGVAAARGIERGVDFGEPRAGFVIGEAAIRQRDLAGELRRGDIAGDIGGGREPAGDVFLGQRQQRNQPFGLQLRAQLRGDGS